VGVADSVSLSRHGEHRNRSKQRDARRLASLLKPAFSLDPAKRILLYSGVVQRYKICTYYVTVFRVLKVFRKAAPELDPRLAVKPGRPRFFVGIPEASRLRRGPVRKLLTDLALQNLQQKGSGSASKD
jgi:hypothetical protein